MPTCQKKDQLCRCIDWPDEDFDVEIDHFIRNFEFLHVELEYASLDAREPVRVRRIGRCRVCGGRMCDGTTLPPEKTVRELMPTICLLAGLAFQQFGYPLPAGTSSFREVFPTLFHEEDQAFAKQWLSEPEGWHLKLTRAWDLLALAAFIRETVRKSPSSPSGDFRSRLGETERLSTQDFAELSMARFRNDPHVNGAFQVDFPSGRFSFVMPGEGWRSYALKDISAAIYKAGRKSGLSKLERLHRFFDALTDKLYFTSEVEWNGGSGDV